MFGLRKKDVWKWEGQDNDFNTFNGDVVAKDKHDAERKAMQEFLVEKDMLVKVKKDKRFKGKK